MAPLSLYLSEAQGLSAFPAGGDYVVLDVGAEDSVELIGSVQAILTNGDLPHSSPTRF